MVNVMDDSYLDVTADYVNECKITRMSCHSFTPYSNMSLSNNDKIRISVFKYVRELYLHRGESK